MELANPNAAWWGLLALPIVVFYILKIRLRRAPVSTVMFWNQIFEEKRPRSIWQRLRHLLSLLVQLTLLALVVAALVDPAFLWEKRQTRRLVLVVDNSASMNATDESPTRLDAARRQAGRRIDALRPRDEMAIVSAGSTPRVACGLTGHQRTLRRALAGLPATDGPTAVPAAVELARRLLADHEHGQIVVLTDGAFDGVAALADADRVQLVAVGGQAGNVGITQFQVRRSVVDPIGYQMLVEVTNFSDQAVSCRLDVDLNDAVVDAVPLQLAPGERWSRAIDQTTAEGGRLVARLDRADALAADNRAVALLPARQKQPVLLVTEGSLFLQRVLQAMPLVELAMTDQLPAQVPAGTVAVFHRRVPPALPAGNVLVVQPLETAAGWTVGEAIEMPLVTKQSGDSPLMTHVKLDNVLMPDARKLTFREKPLVLAESIGGEPLYCAWERPQGKVLLLNVDLAKGDLPLRTAFPIMMMNALHWFEGSHGELRQALAAGSMTDVDLAPLSQEKADSPRSLVLQSPRGRQQPLPPGVKTATVGPLDECGVWTVRAKPRDGAAEAARAAPPAVELACNLSSPSESDLRPRSPLRASQQAAIVAWGGYPLWFYLAALSLLLAAAEWSLYQRRHLT